MKCRFYETYLSARNRAPAGSGGSGLDGGAQPKGALTVQKARMLA